MVCGTISRGLLIFGLLTGLSACGAGGPEPDASPVLQAPANRAAILAEESVDGPLQSELTVRSVQRGALGLTDSTYDPTDGTRTVQALVNYAAGLDINSPGAVAEARVAQSDVGPAVTHGTAQYDTQYNYVLLNNVRVENGRPSADVITPLGDQRIILDADFGAGTLTGSTSDLAVNGTIDGAALGGSVTVTPTLHVSVDAPLQGEIGRDGVAGAFAGANATAVVAGGLVGKGF